MGEPDGVTVSMRRDEMETPPVPGSEVSTCENCGHDVWVSPATQQSISEGTYPSTIWCVRCVNEEEGDDA